MKKNIIKVLVCASVFSIMFSTMASASGSFNSTYSITSPCCTVGSLTGSTNFNVSSNNRNITITLSNSTHRAGNVNVGVQRRNSLGIWGAAGTSTSIIANGSGTIRSGDSGTHRLRMWNQFNGATATGTPAGTATNSGSIRVSH